ncbi:glypican-5 isoform X5 [Motacilla alba alba]|uniref:glypican-5 isoform X5 n=1 Tax=Motacilla alba alba TaxID=1094192 RepID=UPI0018D561F2|nr:glypican-5 isoform X5 [Motacilla alba alba]
MPALLLPLAFSFAARTPRAPGVRGTAGVFPLVPSPDTGAGQRLPRLPWAWGPLLGRGPGRGRVPAGRRAVPPPRRRVGAPRPRPRGSWRRSRAMGGKSFCFAVLTVAVLLLAAASVGAEPPPSCEAVRKVFQVRRLGPLGGVPEFPRAGVDLQVCTSENPTCCTKKMEERYQIAAKQDIQQVLQTSSATLKFLISRNAAAFQETFEMLIRLAENYTSTLFCNVYRNMAAEAAVHVQEFFTDVGLFLFGADASTEEFVNRFFDTLFPVVYNHVINPGPTDISLEYAECLRAAARDIRPFGNIPKKAVGHMARSLLPSRTFLQALNLGVEVINTTDHLHFSRDCSRALLRMQYCPHCQGLTLSKPCMGYCLNTIRGCLAGVAEVDLHWRKYIQSLEELSGALSGAHGIEHVLLNFHSLVHDALVQARINGPELSEQVNKICGPPVRKPKQSPGCSFDQNKHNQVLKMFSRDSEQTLTNRRKEFISHLRLYRAFYSNLADQLCGNELAAADGLPCWNGEDVVRSYTHRVVGSGIKAQSANPEVKVKGTDPVISQIIDKLKHVIQPSCKQCCNCTAVHTILEQLWLRSLEPEDKLSQNSGLAEVDRTSGDRTAQPLCSSRATQNELPRTMSKQFWNTSEMETPQPLQATRASVWSRSQKQSAS